MVFKGLQRRRRANRSYPQDDKTAAICGVKTLEWAKSPSCALFLAYFCRFTAISTLFMSSRPNTNLHSSHSQRTVDRVGQQAHHLFGRFGDRRRGTINLF